MFLQEKKLETIWELFYEFINTLLLDLLYSMYFSLNYKENKKKKIKIADEYENFTSSLIRDTSNDLIK